MINQTKNFLLILTLLLSVGVAAADDLSLRLQRNGGEGYIMYNTAGSSAPSLSFTLAGARGFGTDSVSYGGVDIDVNSIWPEGPNGGGQVSGSSTIHQDCIFTTDPALDGSQGTILFSTRLVGSFLLTSQYGNATFTVDGRVGGYISNNTNLQPQPANDTFVSTQQITFNSNGAPNTLTTEVSAAANSVGSNSVARVHMSVRTGAISLLDGAGNTVSFTSASAQGAARASNVASGGTYAGFSLANTIPPAQPLIARFGTVLTLLDGTASSNSYLQASFTAPPVDFSLVSDAVELAGTNSDPVVVQMTYSPDATQDGLRLAWLNLATGQWTTAVAGNTGGTPHFFARAYNPATDLQLGNYGLDTTNRVAWAVVNHNGEFGVGVVPDAPAATMFVSRETHGIAGDFDLSLPLSGTPGVECRNSGGNHTLVFTFNNNIASGDANVTTGTGTVVGSPTVSGNTMTVNLTGVTNAQTVTVTLSNVTDSFGQVLPNTAFSVGFLIGDTNNDAVVNSGDSLQTRSRSGQSTNATNFRSDVNLDGFVNSGDSTVVRSRSGTSLP